MIPETYVQVPFTAPCWQYNGEVCEGIEVRHGNHYVGERRVYSGDWVIKMGHRHYAMCPADEFGWRWKKFSSDDDAAPNSGCLHCEGTGLLSDNDGASHPAGVVLPNERALTCPACQPIAPKDWLAAILHPFLSQYGWYRRWQGGHWERWSLNLPMAPVWYNLATCSHHTGWRPPCGMSGHLCEDHPR